MHLLQYRREDGQILGVWSSNTREMLVGHILQDDPERGYLLTEADLPSAQELGEHWRVQQGQLQPITGTARKDM